MNAKFNIGDTVYRGTYERHEKWVTCPDCLGSTHIKVVLGDGTEIEIECGGCDPGGYQPSTGIIRQYDYESIARKFVVTGVKVTTIDVNYELDNFGSGSYYTGDDGNVFATREEAIAKAGEDRIKYEDEENKRLMAKTKNHKSWAWNATYHRTCIKRFKDALEYHNKKIKISEAKAKDVRS